MGAWVGYGLGSESQNLPGFVVLNGGLIPPGGLDNFNSGFLPAAYQGSVFRAGDPPVANIAPPEPTDAAADAASSTCCSKLDARRRATASAQPTRSSRRSPTTRLAFRMQAAVPGADGPQGRDRRDEEALRPRRRLPAHADLRPRSA